MADWCGRANGRTLGLQKKPACQRWQAGHPQGSGKGIVSGARYVGRVESLGAVLNFELDLLPFRQRLEAIHLNG